MIYNILGDSKDKNVYYDLRNLLSYIDSFCAELGFESFEIDDQRLVAVLHLVRQDFPHKDGIENSNPFKKVAYFIVNFMAERPMQSSFPDTFKINETQLNTIKNHQNAIIAYAIATDSLVNAEIYSSRAGVVKPIILKNKIKVSKHSYVDIIDALC
ncbi:hypothetical protein [Sulfurovum sp.]|uniref:hypothetical protein n=1 Tax=Sulfurovum sp. TaxID=1969726 RepID=UPI002867E010|nr:hypothetical protein [Sulfurovum sp.]